MADPRMPRDLVSREKTARSVYVPPSTLPDPTPEPGWVYRWIATAIMSEPDPTNVSKRMREGWVPVKAEDHPELMVPGMPKTGNVEIGGLMLCKQPKEQAEARDAFYAQQAHNQMASVDQNFMRSQDPRMPLISERKTEISRNRFGTGTK